MSKELEQKKENTPKIPRVMKGKLNGVKDGIPWGDPRNPLPTVAQQNAGKLRKKQGIELAKAILNLRFNPKGNEELAQKATEYYGAPIDELTHEMMMHFGQISKAVEQKDTFAYNAFMNRALGMPKQVTEEIGTGTVINVNIEGENDNVIPIQGKVVNG
jgi:hypothetical protein